MRLVVVAPTFNNAATLRAVLDGVARHGWPIIACDDGSTDATAPVLDAWQRAGATGQRHVVTHAANAGKAAALRSGFARAEALGFTHALTIDTDGQHDPDDCPALAARAAARPHAIVVGVRAVDHAAYPRKSRVGRWCSNVLVWLIGGVRVADSQCGLRVYPLAHVRALGAHLRRYAFETEVLARAGWGNVPVEQVDVRCIYPAAAARVTHFRPWRDSLSAAAMHVGLIARALLPWPARKLRPVDDLTDVGTIAERGLRWMNPLRTWRRVRADAAERDRFAASVGIGLFIGSQPMFGFKTLLCLLVARPLRLQPLVTLGASSLTTPPVGLAIWCASIIVGHVLLHGALPAAERYDVARLGGRAVFANVALEWIVGGLLCGAALGVTAWLATRAALSRWPLPPHASEREVGSAADERG